MSPATGGAAALALLLCACAPSTPEGAELLHLSASRVIERPVGEVFALAADPSREHLWRAEVSAFSANGPPGIGTVLSERIDLGLFSGYVTRARITRYDPPHGFSVASPPEHPRIFRASRHFTALPGGRTRVDYHARVDRRVIRDLMGFALAPEIAVPVYEYAMESYLARLARLLERPAR